MVKKQSAASLKAQRKADEYAAIMAAKAGLPARLPPAEGAASAPAPEKSLVESILEQFPGAKVSPVNVSERQRTNVDFASEAKSDSVTPSPPISSHPHFRDQGICQICKATSCGGGWAPNWNMKPLWFCESCGPRGARRFYAMRQGKLNEYEKNAIQAAGASAGQYLDEIGTTDLLSLTFEQYSTFCEKFLVGYVESMRSLTAVAIPPE